jgi:replication initiation and membrane attachment protein DnaB
LVYVWAHFKYANKKSVDECYNERSNLKTENQSLKHQVDELKKLAENLHKEIDHSRRELMEKNKYLSENTIVIERLFEVKQLSDKISNILLDYDKNTIQTLLEEYKN